MVSVEPRVAKLHVHGLQQELEFQSFSGLARELQAKVFHCIAKVGDGRLSNTLRDALAANRVFWWRRWRPFVET